MRSDRRGDMGFMEAMVAFMAVSVVLTAFMGALATTTVVTADPTGSLDPGEFTGTIEDGVFVPGFVEYIDGFADTRGCDGVTVSVTVPGGFCEEVEPYVRGYMDGMLFSRTMSGHVADDAGRVLPAFYEVVLCI